MRRIGIAAVVFAAALAGCAAAVPPHDLFDEAARAAMARTGARGLVIATIEGAQVREVRAWGARDAQGAPLGPDTVMDAASLTKAAFGFLVTQLAAEGRVELDRPIADLLPRALPSYGNVASSGHWGDLVDDDRWRVITPRMALNHATGFANFASLERDGRLRIHFEPGTRYAYSGEGIMLLQFGLERGLGIDIEAEMQRRFFVPLGMARTALRWQPGLLPDIADGWRSSGQPVVYDRRSRVRAAGSMVTSGNDFARLAAAMVRGEGLPDRWRDTFAEGTLPITTRSQFPTLADEAPASLRPDASAALGDVAFSGPQGPGWMKGGHDDATANLLVCLSRDRRCLLIFANDVRAERAFPRLVRVLLGETGAPLGWEYPAVPAESER